MPQNAISACPQPSSHHAVARIVVLSLVYVVLIVLVLLGLPVDAGIEVVVVGGGAALMLSAQLLSGNQPQVGRA
ncbi:hypothetical protein [Saccharopolyspora dendranthemae]|uniref:Uncharacterized protein n=1 Tax=Saccharopolyspora dendranthemae TaxID=1181886 RepID=A0A561U8J2_9PSEU|nr:hypothetical protein [Saccharopolyspora dendranthemae]TWF95690.1 hypothetical protein FHU35_12689 [Saccharopolyspora dendranthemae]